MSTSPSPQVYPIASYRNRILRYLDAAVDAVPGNLVSRWTPEKLVSRWSPGIGTDGKPVWIDHTAQPHAIIAGSTASGKTVHLRNLVFQAAYANSPDLLKFWVVGGTPDTQFFARLPHTVAMSTFRSTPEEEQADASALLRTLQGLHNARLEAMAAHPDEPVNVEQCRKIALDETAAAARGVKPWWDTTKDHPLWMPSIYVILEDFHSILEHNSEAAIDIVSCLATISRRTGIHMTMTIQRPSDDVVPQNFRLNATTMSGYVSDHATADYVGDLSLSIAGHSNIPSGQTTYIGVDTTPLRFRSYLTDKDVMGMAAARWGGVRRDEAAWRYDGIMTPAMAALTPHPKPKLPAEKPTPAYGFDLGYEDELDEDDNDHEDEDNWLGDRHDRGDAGSSSRFTIATHYNRGWKATRDRFLTWTKGTPR